MKSWVQDTWQQGHYCQVVAMVDGDVIAACRRRNSGKGKRRNPIQVDNISISLQYRRPRRYHEISIIAPSQFYKEPNRRVH